MDRGKGGDRVTPHQALAVANPCYFGFETIHPRFAYLHSPIISIVLTVNSGYE